MMWKALLPSLLAKKHRRSTGFFFVMVVITTSFAQSFGLSTPTPSIAPELQVQHVQNVQAMVSSVMSTPKERYEEIRSFVSSDETDRHQFVYGELGISVLGKLLDAVGVYEEERFLDIGSGDGGLVLGAKLLYPERIQTSTGIELVPQLVERSLHHSARLKQQLPSLCNGDDNIIDFVHGNIYENDERIDRLLARTTIGVCFATTWSRQSTTSSLNGRKLPQLSSALGTSMKKSSRIVVVDGRLLSKDGFAWEGDLKVECEDTAPYSIASLYRKV